MRAHWNPLNAVDLHWVSQTGARLSESRGTEVNSPPALEHLGNETSSKLDETDQSLRLIDGLRQRRLFDLAESYCNQSLADENLGNEQLAVFTIELIKTRTSRALLAMPTQRDFLWEQAHQTATQFSQQYSQHPRELLVRLQQGLIYLAHGQLIQQEIEGEMIPHGQQDVATENALVQLRAANALFDDLERAITRQIPLQQNRGLEPGEFTVDELLRLSQQVRLQLATVNLQRAKLYSVEDRLNRVDALNRVLDRLQEIQKGTAPNQPIWWENQVLLVETYRLLKQIKNAEGIVKRANEIDQTEEFTNPIKAKWYEQLIRLSLDKGDFEALTRAVYNSEQILNRSPQLELARLRAAREFSQRSTGEERTEWLNKAAYLARGIEAQHGSYWGRRAKLILIAGVDGPLPNDSMASNATIDSQPSFEIRQAGGAEIDLLIGLAEQAVRQDRLEDAFKAYHRAATLAFDLDGNDLAFSLALLAGQTLEKMGQHQTGANYLLELAVNKKNHPLASAAHLRGLWNRGKEIGFVPKVDESSDSQQQRSQFVKSLHQHMAIWSNHSSQNQVRYWLGNHHYSLANLESTKLASPANGGKFSELAESPAMLRHWELAIENFLAVESVSPFFEDSMRRSVSATRQLVAQSPEALRNKIARVATAKWKALLDVPSQTNAPSDPSGDASSGGDAIWLRWKLTVSVIIAEFGVEQGTISINELIDLLVDGLPSQDQLMALNNAGNSSITAKSSSDILQAKSWLWASLVLAGDEHPQRRWQTNDLLEHIAAETEWLAVAEQALMQMNAQWPQRASESIHQERLKLFERIFEGDQDRLNEDQKIAWRFRQADALIELKRFEEALPILMQLEQQRPRDAGIQLRIARLVTELERASNPEVPLQRWQRLVGQLKPHTDGWYEAKFQIAWLLEQTGKQDEARKFLEYLRAIPPGWENSKLRDQFESLLLRCQR